MKKIIHFLLVAVISFTINGFFISQAHASAFDLNENGIPDASESDIIVSTNQTLPAGEYFFNNLFIQNGATLLLESDPDSLNSFKGVKLNVNNLTVDDGAHFSADATGYRYNYSTGYGGPGTLPNSFAGASYGGVGGQNTATSTYGSAMKPIDIGSAGNGYFSRGGGAIRLSVSGTLLNNGVISADGSNTSSGGSLYISSSVVSGSGVFRADGGRPYCPNVCYFAGGGGRIAIYYSSFNFTGDIFAKGGCYSFDGWSTSCVSSGTIGLIDTDTNDLYPYKYWRFEKVDSPFNLNNVFIKNGSQAATQDDVIMNFNGLSIDGASALSLSKNNVLTVPKIFLNNGILGLSGEESLKTSSLDLSSGSTVSVNQEKILNLTIPNISISSDSSISADERGYGYGTGPGTSADYFTGASYGGIGYQNLPDSVYGSDAAPVDLGSGGWGYHPHGGGAIRLVVSDTLLNDGKITANGSNTSSGGSIYVTAGKLSGSGVFQANGGSSYCPNMCIGPGGGGRVAVYYETSDFIGEAKASGWSGYGGSSSAGTVVFKNSVQKCSTNCFSNVLFIPGIMGSKLYEQKNSSEQELWVSSLDSNHQDLELDKNGKSLKSVYSKDDTVSVNDEPETGIVDEVYGANIYNSFINDLRNWKKDGVIQDYAFIPYDWRLSLNDIITNGATTTDGRLSYTNTQNFSESFLYKKLKELVSSSKSGKVTIIAHSNGGLVTKALVQKLKDNNDPLYNKIDKIIFVAVPQVGTPDALFSLLHGSSLAGGLIMTNQRSRWLAENMPTVYNLLPSTSYFTTVDPNFAVDKMVSFQNDPTWQTQISQYGFFVSNQSELKNYVLGSDGRTKPGYFDTDSPSIGNSKLYADSESAHSALDSWQPSTSTKVIQIAGWGEETLSGIDYKKCGDKSVDGYHKCFSFRSVVDGDGTVVVPSALWMSTTSPNVERWWVNLKNANTLLSIKRIHRDIIEISNLRDFIKSQITNNNFSDNQEVVVNNTSSLKSTDIRLHYTLHSPLTLGVTDSQGRYTGLDPVSKKIIEDIPGVTYRQVGDTQYISLPEEISHTLKLSGYDSGSFSLDIDEQTGNLLQKITSFQAVPVSTTTTATLDYLSGTNISSTTLNVDLNGDGNNDISLNTRLGEIVKPPVYKWSGFSQPINDTKYYPNQTVSIFKGGSTVPVKFQIKDFDGKIVQSKTMPKWLVPEKLSPLSSPVSESVVTTTATSGYDFKWDSTDKQYIYNWSTKGFVSGYWYRISTKLDDGYVYSVIVGLR